MWIDTLEMWIDSNTLLKGPSISSLSTENSQISSRIITLELVSFYSDQILHHYHVCYFSRHRDWEMLLRLYKTGVFFPNCWWWLGVNRKHISGCIHWNRAHDMAWGVSFRDWTHFTQCALRWFLSLMLRAKVLGVVVWFPPEADPEIKIQDQLVSWEGFQEAFGGQWEEGQGMKGSQ